jgi:RNA polymerase sigma-70 factor (sigma-E family)
MTRVDIGGAIVDEGQGVRTWLEEPAVTAADSGEVAGCPVRVGESQAADGAAGQATNGAADRAADQAANQDAVRAADQDAARGMAALHAAHYQSLVGLAVLLLRDVATAEEVVQDSFVAMHANWRRLRDSGKALSYLRQCVVNKSRSVMRHRIIVDRHALQLLPDMPSAEQGAMALLERSAVIAALHELSDRQREAVVLRYYAEFSEAQIASAMGISRGAVKSHTARAISALRDVLEHFV